jgi:hypothetical protein
MDRTDLVRLRWRLSGAWFWPSFIVLTLVDGAIIHWLPPEGDSASAIGAWLAATTLMLVAVVFLGPVFGALLRRRRGDLPKLVARNYAGTFLALGVSVALVAVGLAHHPTITRDRAAMLDASQRAEAWIGAHAPPQFMTDISQMSTVEIQAPELYRSCVENLSATKTYCVVVNRAKPFGTGVHFAGYESNQLLEQGVQ